MPDKLSSSPAGHSNLPLPQRWRRRSPRWPANLNSLAGFWEVMEQQRAWRQCQFSERFLQILWNERHLTAQLQCQDGRTLKIVSPGIWNVGSGPDFRQAALLFDGRLASGDVEVHRHSSDWERHGHSRDSAYDKVILHVVWEDDCPDLSANLPTLVLNGHLHSAWEQLLWEMEDACYPYCRQVPAGACALRWAMADNQRLLEILTAAGLARFAAKAARLARLCAERGADQALYEAVFDALGYQHNRKPFRQLAEQIKLEQLRQLPHDSDRAAILFGASGLLPDPTCQPVLPIWLDTVSDYWGRWWAMGAPRLNLAWSAAMSRPYNSPCRRLAAGLSWLQQVNYAPTQWLRQVSRQASSATELRKKLTNFTPPSDSLWQQHRDFGHQIRPPAALLGKSRCLDIAANVFLPFLGALLEMNQPAASTAESSRVELAWQQLPPSQNNRLLAEAAQRFLTPPSRAVELLKTSCQQQGLIDIYQNFCQALDHNCELCPLEGAAGKQ